MNRYKINLTAMQWGIIAMDLGKLPEPEDSTQALKSLIMVALDHGEDDTLPYNVERADDQG